MTLHGQTGGLKGLCLAQGMLDPNTLENSPLVSSQGAWVLSSVTKSMSKLAFLQSRSSPGGHETRWIKCHLVATELTKVCRDPTCYLQEWDPICRQGHLSVARPGQQLLRSPRSHMGPRCCILGVGFPFSSSPSSS